MARRSRSLRALLALAAGLLLATPAAAGGHMSMQAGGFVPFQGDAGYSLLVQLLGSNKAARARFGGEFEYRHFDSKIMGVSDVDVSSYVLHAVWQQHFLPDKPVTPYIGLAFGIAINHIDDGKVDRAKGRNVIGPTGVGPDGCFMLGVDGKIPGAEYMSLYAEGRVGFSFSFAGRQDETAVETENVGGLSGSAGLRFHF